ncbi:ferritin-like domain-containing protein [Patulibacter sp. SYSU D01012]|uniref:ferritin-like domain-containing protein n=1 Tax=Patulibacter sp. SYSU D01012 TaxID=2817381 RepID=UPI001B30C418
MSQQIDLEKLDVDGDVREAAEAAGIDRSTFLRNGALAGAGAVGLGVFGLPSLASATISTKKPSKKNDVKILNYALTLEYLEAAFYDAANKQNQFATPELAQFSAVVGKHEADHVKFLEKGLGKAAIKAPKLDLDAVAKAIAPASFGPTALALEDTGVAAYAGQGPNLKTRAFVQAALSIHSVEARHAAWIRVLLGGAAPGAAKSAQPAPFSFDKPKTEKTVLKVVGGTGLVVASSIDTKKI